MNTASQKFSLSFFIVLLGATLFAQNPYGRITGRVVDSTGAMVVGAQVRVVQLETNIVTTATASSNGVYDIPNLLPGTYRIEVAHKGFKHYERGPVEVGLGDAIGLDIPLELGAVGESVTVTTEASLLETATASASQTLDNRTLTDMPMGERSFTYLMTTAPGIISTTAPMHGWLTGAQAAATALASAGSAVHTSEFSLDGIPDMGRAGSIQFTPPPEMIQEVRIQMAGYDASIGHMAGAQVNIAMKSGTNAYHGNLFYSYLSRPLMSDPFFVNKALYDLSTGPPTAAKRNSLFPNTATIDYRGRVGGPVRIPGLYNGRNRTFFSYGYEWQLRISPTNGYDTVPTAKERTGDFSALLALGGQYQIYDPATIAAASGGQFSRQPLPGNIIPASRQNPISQKLQTYYPLPNATGTADGLNNEFLAFSSHSTFQDHMIRVDQVLGPNHRMYGSFVFNPRTDGSSKSGQTFNNAIGSSSKGRAIIVGLDDVFTPRPDLVVDIRAGLVREKDFTNPLTLGMDLAPFGFSPNLLSQIDRVDSQLPAINISGYTAFGTDTIKRGATQSMSLGGSVLHVRSSHSLKIGAELRLIQSNQASPGRISPSYTFAEGWTKGPLSNSTAAPVGQGYASFLFGLPTSGFTDRNASYAETSPYYAVYFQDDWKVTRKLSVNLGLRYELEAPSTERYNRSVRGFAFDTASPIAAAAIANYTKNPIAEVPVSQFTVRGGLLFAGVNGQPRGLWNTDANNFCPRAGIAYQVKPKTVVRAGYGIFFATLADRTDVNQQGFSQQTALVASPDNGLTFTGSLANPFPNGILQPAGASLGMNTALGQSPGFFWPDAKGAYVQRWSLDVERELPYRLFVDVGYMGNRSTGLGVSRNFDALPDQYLSKLPVRDQATINYLTGAVANPFFGIPQFSGTGLQNATVPRVQLLTPMPQFQGLTTTVGDGFSWYHAGTLRVEKRFSRGYSLHGAYTFSKYMEAIARLNAGDLQLHHAISTSDRPHHVAISGTWDIPFAPKKLWGGWSLNAIYQWQSGAPIVFANIIFNGNLHDIVLPSSQRTLDRWFNTDAGFNKVSSQQLANNLRAFPLRLTGLRQDAWNYWDISVIKNFHFREWFTFQLRGEAVDAFNHPIFSAPNTVPTSSLFGQVTGTQWTEQRKITVVGKLTW